MANIAINRVGLVILSTCSGYFRVLRRVGSSHEIRFFDTGNTKLVRTSSMIHGQARDLCKYEGLILDSVHYGKFKVIKYLRTKKHVVKFLDTGNECEVWTSSMLRGSIKDREAATVYGVGIVGYAYKLSLPPKYVDGKYKQIVDPYYAKWVDMLGRCYCDKWLSKYPTYKGCYVCEEWKYFPNFKNWMISQGFSLDSDWRSMHLDKDILVEDNKCYSPDTCLLVSHDINQTVKDSLSQRGEYAMGVSYKAGIKKFTSMHINTYLGVFYSEEDAHRAWQEAKISHVSALLSGQSDNRVIKGLRRILDKIQYEHDNNLITESY
jgi:hypothetical protein